jgi:uncharacterized metal-binding protein
MVADSAIVFMQPVLRKTDRPALIQVKVWWHMFRPRNARSLTQVKAFRCDSEQNAIMNERENKEATSKGKIVVYACSGCSDAGELADRIARRLNSENIAEMSCLAGIGGRVKPLVNKAATADRILAIDGCPLNCTRHTLELAGFNKFEHLELHKLGLRKHSCPVTEQNVDAGLEAAKKILAEVI